MTVVVVDYGAGNLRSAAKALAVAARDSGRRVVVSADPATVAEAERVVLPGVGAFADCRAGLDRIPGLVEALSESALRRRRPFLGICVGMQLMASLGIEYGSHRGLDWIKGRVVRLTPADPGLKIPQMGWNDLVIAPSRHKLFAGLPVGAHGYFVHSYHFLAENPAEVLASVDYGGPVVAAVGRDNLVGLQFHPEKSQQVGLQILANFMSWAP